MIAHERKPFPYSESEIEELAGLISDPNYRVQVSDSKIHIYNRDGIHSSRDAFELYPQLDEIGEDTGHAFYLGYELAKAEIALELGKRYVQDEKLNWGVANKFRDEEDLNTLKAEGSPLKTKKNTRKRRT